MKAAAVRLLAAGLMAVGAGCVHEDTPHFIQERLPDDVRLIVYDLSYRPTISGYTFRYSEDDPGNPCPFTTEAFVRQDSVVGIWAIQSLCVAKGGAFSALWLRRNWDQLPTTQGSKEQIEQITPLRGRRPGRY